MRELPEDQDPERAVSTSTVQQEASPEGGDRRLSAQPDLLLGEEDPEDLREQLSRQETVTEDPEERRGQQLHLLKDPQSLETLTEPTHTHTHT